VEKAGCGLADPVCLDLGQGRILAFRGRIDRIDQLAEGDYCVWDYKTGSAADYGEQLYFNKGQQVQHALYALAAEEILRQISPRKSAKVRFAGYIFPSRKGEGWDVSHPVKNRELLVSLLNTACEVVESGTFVASHEASRCRYCEYATVCIPESAVQRAKNLVGNRIAVRLDPWRRLQEYV
jgi:ATP-dependent helicase/nuclease subunit B